MSIDKQVTILLLWVTCFVIIGFGIYTIGLPLTKTNWAYFWLCFVAPALSTIIILLH